MTTLIFSFLLGIVVYQWLRIRPLFTRLQKLGEAPVASVRIGHQCFYSAGADEGFQEYCRARWYFEHKHPVWFWILKRTGDL